MPSRHILKCWNMQMSAVSDSPAVPSLSERSPLCFQVVEASGSNEGAWEDQHGGEKEKKKTMMINELKTLVKCKKKDYIILSARLKRLWFIWTKPLLYLF